MDDNWRPTQGSDPAAGGAGVELNAPAGGGDWRAQLQPEERSRIVNRILETLKKDLPVSSPEELNELHRIAVQFEENVYSAATNQRKISRKMVSVEMETQQAPGNARVILNQNYPAQASEDSTAQTGHASAASVDNTAQTGHTGVGDWQEEAYQMINSLKDQHFAELNELFNKISVKLQHVDSIIPPQMPSEPYERMKSFNIMLGRILQILQISKNNIQPSLRDSVPQYEKRIIGILNARRRKPVQPQVQQHFQPPNSNISQQ